MNKIEGQNDSSFNEFFRGNKPLWKSYWLYFAVTTYAIALVFSLIAQALRSRFLVYVFTFNIFIWCAFAIHGVWKSSEKYTGNVFWKYLSRISVLCGSVWYIVQSLLTSTFVGK